MASYPRAARSARSASQIGGWYHAGSFGGHLPSLSADREGGGAVRCGRVRRRGRGGWEGGGHGGKRTPSMIAVRPVAVARVGEPESRRRQSPTATHAPPPTTPVHSSRHPSPLPTATHQSQSPPCHHPPPPIHHHHTPPPRQSQGGRACGVNTVSGHGWIWWVTDDDGRERRSRVQRLRQNDRSHPAALIPPLSSHQVEGLQRLRRTERRCTGR